jgi:hypothetical protein
MSGPHLERTLVKTAMTEHRQSLPVLNVGTTSKCMTNDHYIVGGFAERSPSLVRDGHIPEYDTTV